MFVHVVSAMHTSIYDCCTCWLAQIDPADKPVLPMSYELGLTVQLGSRAVLALHNLLHDPAVAQVRGRARAVY